MKKNDDKKKQKDGEEESELSKQLCLHKIYVTNDRQEISWKPTTMAAKTAG